MASSVGPNQERLRIFKEIETELKFLIQDQTEEEEVNEPQTLKSLVDLVFSLFQRFEEKFKKVSQSSDRMSTCVDIERKLKFLRGDEIKVEESLTLEKTSELVFSQLHMLEKMLKRNRALDSRVTKA